MFSSCQTDLNAVM